MAVSKNGTALRYAADALKADRAFVLTALSKNGAALKYAAEALKADREFMLTALSKMAMHWSMLKRL